MEISINWLAVLVAALSAFVLGGLWYSLLFAKPWQRMAGVSDEQLKSGVVRIFAVSFVLAIVMAVVLAAFIGREGVAFGLFAGLAVGLGWVATSFGMVALFERRPFGHWAVNAGYAVVTYTVMGAIIGAMQA